MSRSRSIARALASRIERDGTRRRTQLFSGFLSHYLIRDRYGRPGKGNDKGAVEGLVGWSRRNFMVLPFDEWTETFGSERLTGALLDRLTHHVHILEMNGESFRLNHSRARKKDPAG